MILMQLAVVILCAVWSIVAAATFYALFGGTASLCLLVGVVLLYGAMVVSAARSPTGAP